MRKAFFFGDSNTYGYDPAGFMGGRYPRAYRWTTILQESLRDSWEIAADGMPGRAVPGSRYERDYLRAVLRQVMPVDLFAVMLGSNDILGTPRPDAARTAREMDDMLLFVGKILEEGQEAGDRPRKTEILLIAPPEIVLTELSFGEPYVSGDRNDALLYHEEGRKLSQYYGELAARRKIRFADAAEWKLDFAYDGVHLSEEGHARFAAEMEKVLRGL